MTPAATLKRIAAESPLMTVAEVGAYLRATPSWVRHLIVAGELPFQRQGKAFLVLRADVEAYIRACRGAHRSPNIVQNAGRMLEVTERKGT
jgi:excisionase family DNA binding protein